MQPGDVPATYADVDDLMREVDFRPATPIGVSCRICERDNCAQRAFPPVDRTLHVPKHERIARPLHEIIKVDLYVPGCPPPPLAILHALLLQMLSGFQV